MKQSKDDRDIKNQNTNNQNTHQENTNNQNTNQENTNNQNTNHQSTMNQSDIDQTYMQMAIELAKQGCGRVNPNPMVGAVIVKDGNIIGKGYHQMYGGLHAERNALADCSSSPHGATMYVTLEPCCHYGKTPPCTKAIIESGIVKVVIGAKDPNPKVAGKGIEALREAGIQVVEQVNKEACDALNEVFYHYIQNKTPYVVMKYAMTIDGKIATYTGASRWITGEEAREDVHQDRNRYAAIMVGIGTVLQDDPMLTCRIKEGEGRNPIRIIVDTTLRTPIESKLVQTAKDIPTILATMCTDNEKINLYRKKNCQVLLVNTQTKQESTQTKQEKPQTKQESAQTNHTTLDLHDLMKKLAAMGIDSILLEGGSTLHWSALQSGIVQKVKAYIAPKIFGGSTAKTPIGGIGVEVPQEAYKLKNSKIISLGEDFLIESEVEL